MMNILFEKTHTASPFDAFQENEDSRRVSEALERLPKREKSILNMHYGLNGEAGMTFSQIGLRLGISRQRAQQIEKNAISKLQATLGVNQARLS